jgi:hypothetical protein
MMSGSALRLRVRRSSGTSVRCAAASEETPTICTSFSTAWRAARRRGEQRPDVDVEAEIGEGRGDHLLAAVVAVLADLGDQDARPAALVGLELVATSFCTRATASDIMPASRL